MIVDVHTHTPKYKGEVPEEVIEYNTVARPDRAVKRPVSWGEFMEDMKPVDKVIVFNMAREGEEDVNDSTAEFMRAFPDKVIGFLSVHPFDPGCMDEIDRCVSDLGLKGMKLGPNYQNFDPLCDEAIRVYKRCEELKLPIVFHTGTNYRRFADLDYAHPRHFDSIAIICPELKIVLAHMSHPWQTTCISVIRKHPNVYADCSALFYRPWSFYNCMRLAEEWGVMHKLLFGTDYAVSTPEENFQGFRLVNQPVEGTGLPRVSLAAMEEIIHRDSLGLLGLA
jgi:predicted TIM-barrel fold metal-dependent hydrolase